MYLLCYTNEKEFFYVYKAIYHFFSSCYDCYPCTHDHNKTKNNKFTEVD